jgi:hypothetical protein
MIKNSSVSFENSTNKTFHLHELKTHGADPKYGDAVN